MNKLMSVGEAQARLQAAVSSLSVETLSLNAVLNRVLAETVAAGFDLPLFNNSGMDGFAVRAEDLKNAAQSNPIELRVVGDIPAGVNPSVDLQPGQAARIVTGAIVPGSADAVIPVEDTDLGRLEPGSAAPDQVKIFRPVSLGENIRRKGEDIRSGDVILEPNIRLQPQHVGILAMLGVASVDVFRKPRVGLLSTGDELLPVGSPLEPGKIYEANGYTLGSLITQNGGESLSLGICADQPDAVQSILDRSVNQDVDLILSSAGVSMGAYDYVRMILEQKGELGFWRVNMRPGKPLAFGHYRGIPFIGLPGNPVSAFVGFEVFVRPVLNKMSGLLKTERKTRTVQLLEPVQSDGRESYLRAIVENQDGNWFARLTRGHQGSGNLLSLVQANALIIIPSGVQSLPAGAQVSAWLLN